MFISDICATSPGTTPDPPHDIMLREVNPSGPGIHPHEVPTDITVECPRRGFATFRDDDRVESSTISHHSVPFYLRTFRMTITHRAVGWSSNPSQKCS